eukprot:Trichotokara_eunicae@DN6468_c0_g1_i1.p1
MGEDGNEIVVLDAVNRREVLKKPTKAAEGALMHPSRLTVALKGKAPEGSGHFVQVFDLQNKARICGHTFTDDVIFWKWASDDILAIVTKSYVFHWDTTTNEDPTK